MKSYTGATLLLNENGSWWLFRGIPNPYTVWVDVATGKAIDTPKNFDEFWQVPALSGMPGFTDIQTAVDGIVPKDMFKIKDMVVLKEEIFTRSKGDDALIYVRVESIEKSDHHLTETDEYRLFSPDELERLEHETSDNDYSKPTFKFMASIRGSLPETDSVVSSAFVPYKSQHEIVPNVPVPFKIFYIPVILNGFDLTHAGYILGSEGAGSKPQLLSYASRVMPGQTLEQAIAKDLKQDFRYDGRFTIDSSYYYDTIQDKQGVDCNRFVVNIVLTENYIPNGVRLFGKTIKWVSSL